MTLPNSWVLFYVHEKKELYDQERLQRFFTGLAECNCYIAPDAELASLAIWRKYLVNASTPEKQKRARGPFANALKPGVSEGLRREVLIYMAERMEQLTIAARSMARSPLVRGFEFTVTLAPQEGYILLSIEQERFFRPTLDGLAKYRYWIKIIEKTCACWQPLYAHEFTHQGPPSVNPSWEDVHALEIPALYDLNIYGPELVQQIGQERLLDTPAWVVRELEGQACLLIPTDRYGVAPGSYNYEDVARHLGFPVAVETPFMASGDSAASIE
jgi:hypothetical protein